MKVITLRKQIAEALERESLDLREISQRLGIKEREVLDHLEHIARSAGSKRFRMEPAYCHDYYLNMTPVAYDIYVNGAWRTVVIGGNAQGGGEPGEDADPDNSAGGIDP